MFAYGLELKRVHTSDLYHINLKVIIQRLIQLPSVTNVETTCVHPFPALWYTLTLSSMKLNLSTEESGATDTMLKSQT